MPASNEKCFGFTKKKTFIIALRTKTKMYFIGQWKMRWETVLQFYLSKNIDFHKQSLTYIRSFENPQAKKKKNSKRKRFEEATKRPSSTSKRTHNHIGMGENKRGRKRGWDRATEEKSTALSLTWKAKFVSSQANTSTDEGMNQQWNWTKAVSEARRSTNGRRVKEQQDVIRNSLKLFLYWLYCNTQFRLTI